MTVCPLSPREKKEKLLSKRNRNISRKKEMGKYAICPRKKRRASWARGLALPPPEDARHDTRQNHEGNAHKTTNRRTHSPFLPLARLCCCCWAYCCTASKKVATFRPPFLRSGHIEKEESH